MKILCLLVVLANILLFMWEYRSGAFLTHGKDIEQPLISGAEPIILLGELKSLPTNVDQAMPLNEGKPDNITKESHANGVTPDTSTTTPATKPAEDAQP
jgi:hypothetical protein